jgi:hypothetical protein
MTQRFVFVLPIDSELFIRQQAWPIRLMLPHTSQQITRYDEWVTKIKPSSPVFVVLQQVNTSIVSFHLHNRTLFSKVIELHDRP